MKKALKAKWIKALRSGKYKQAQNALWNRSDDAYCCIGVLCRIQGATDGFLINKAHTLAIDEYADGMDAEELRPFAILNDGGKSFAEIAKEIKARL